ncbi:MAG: transglutaminase-like domain-containing protein [Planctomycetota bacterium]|jgi:hypothetical protein
MTLSPAPIAIFAALLSLSPPSGHPPVGPLQRVEPRIYDFTLDATVKTSWHYDSSQPRFDPIVDAPIVVPIVYQGTYSTVAPDSVHADVRISSKRRVTRFREVRIDEGFPFQTCLAAMPIRRFRFGTLRLRFGYRVQVWSSRMTDEVAVASVPWPREWPAEVRDGLQPQLFIESDDPLFAGAVEEVTRGRLRLAPPYLAAKELVRHCIETVQVSGGGADRSTSGGLRGLQVVGARRTATTGVGSPHDLVCVCVAVLRAAGIPARAVIGVEEPPDAGRVRQNRSRPSAEFVSWGELYLPDVGWVPFDPDKMRGRGISSLDVHRPWPAFGTMQKLNRRIPLAYHFIPPACAETPQNPAVWGWNDRSGWSAATEQRVKVTVESRGRGRGDSG